ncbi:MAG: PadR family transcriptional regulator [Bacillota bacterium]
MSLSHAILGLLNYRPATGYELKAVFERSIHFFWNANLPQIYRTLGDMLDRGWLEVKVEHRDGRPSRKVYSVTGAGREELRRWLAAPPEVPPPRNPLLLKVFFGRQIDRATLAGHLRGWRDRHAALLARYDREIAPLIRQYAALAGAEGDARYWELTLDFGRRFSRMVVDWCDAALARITGEEQGRG